jgi:hypothetical protein
MVRNSRNVVIALFLNFLCVSNRIGSIKKKLTSYSTTYDLELQCENPGDTIFQLVSLYDVPFGNGVISNNEIFTIKNIFDKKFIKIREGEKYFPAKSTLFDLVVKVC